jgi:hypothetical protein
MYWTERLRKDRLRMSNGLAQIAETGPNLTVPMNPPPAETVARKARLYRSDLPVYIHVTERPDVNFTIWPVYVDEADWVQG